MNALVNDQVDRLYKWLEGQDRIRLFNFTSETPEDIKAANRAGIPKWDSCRVRTRQEARESPVPDIVITNYSMLEYMLCRPQDSVFFGPALRAVVLDEAHLYTGTLAAEITLFAAASISALWCQSRASATNGYFSYVGYGGR